MFTSLNLRRLSPWHFSRQLRHIEPQISSMISFPFVCSCSRSVNFSHGMSVNSLNTGLSLRVGLPDRFYHEFVCVHSSEM